MNRRLLLLALAPLACTDQVDGLKPVGGMEASPAQQQRFVRRLYLDLTGAPPTDAELAAAASTTAADRGALAQQLIDSPAFATTYVSELENRVFAGEQPESRYQLLCAVYRNFDPACQACPDPTDGDLCHDCSCPIITSLDGERASLDASADDLAAGAATGEIERRYAGAYVFEYFGTAESTAMALFRTFLGREAGPDELRNAKMMVTDQADSPNPRGLLFHRHGRLYTDLVDIVFTSEAYREAVVAATFLRYLGRTPSEVELAHFSSTSDMGLSADAPDARALIRAVVSSREYFEQ